MLAQNECDIEHDEYDVERDEYDVSYIMHVGIQCVTGRGTSESQKINTIKMVLLLACDTEHEHDAIIQCVDIEPVTDVRARVGRQTQSINIMFMVHFVFPQCHGVPLQKLLKDGSESAKSVPLLLYVYSSRVNPKDLFLNWL